MDKHTASTVANLIRFAVKLMDERGRCTDGARGIHGEMCPVMAVVEAAKANNFGVHSNVVRLAVEALDDAARALPVAEKIGAEERPWANDLVRYNELPGRGDIEVKNFMGHVANQVVSPVRKPAKKAAKKVVRVS